MTKYQFGLIFLAALVSGCGNSDGGGVAPPDSSIQILPTSTDYTYTGPSVATSPILGPNFVTVIVNNSSGNPVRGATVTMMHGDNINDVRASDRTGGFGNFQLPGNPYVATTDDFGSVYVYLYTPKQGLVGAYTSSFEAFSGSGYQKFDVNMTCIDINTATTPQCD